MNNLTKQKQIWNAYQAYQKKVKTMGKYKVVHNMLLRKLFYEDTGVMLPKQADITRITLNNLINQ